MKARKLGEILDWAGRAHLVLNLVVALFGQSLIKKLLTYVPHVSHDWDTVIAWAAAGVIIFVLIKRQEKNAARQLVTSAQTPQRLNTNSFPALSTLVPTTPKPLFNSEEFFKTAYYSPLTAEAEKNMRAEADKEEPTDPAAYLARFVGVGVVAFLHEHTWYTIYKSQILTLQELNKTGYLPASAVRGFYDKAAAEYSSIYATYSFDQWLAYIKSEQLILQHPSDMFEITWKGKDYLKYMTHWGYDIGAKKG